MNRPPGLALSTLALALALATLLHGCDGSDENTNLGAQDGAVTVQDAAASNDGQAEPQDAAANQDAGTLPDAQSATDAAASALTEAEWIVHMREEEKLARDVYRALDASSLSFANIAASEQQHMDAVAMLLARYNLSDPVTTLADGVFATVAFQQLYDQLVARGKTSTVAALQVGAGIEDLDLHDLTDALGVATHADVQLVFQNLAKGSRNHLRSFAAQLSQLGSSYTPQYLDAQTYQSIITSPVEAGPNF